MLKLILMLLLSGLSGCALTSMGPRHNIQVDGNALSYIQNRGPGPTVVFEAGLGSDLSAWDEVYERVGDFSRVFAYSRPGYAPGPRNVAIGGKRTARESARLLHDALAKAGTPGPYILVGHSIGGLYALEFARYYPNQVVGLVLVDGRLPGFANACEQAGVSPCAPPDFITLLAPRHVADEIRGIPQSEAEAPKPADIGAIPTTLIAATKPAPGAPDEAQPVWLAEQRRFADALDNGRLVIAQDSGHFIQKDAPDTVVQEIRKLRERVL